MKSLKKSSFIYLGLFVLISIPLFLFIGKKPIQLWDEGRTAINAYEMYKNGNWLVTHYDGKPEMWNTKPPLLTWIQVIFMKLIGINELSIRLPSAIAALFTCFALFIFLKFYLKNSLLGIISMFVLITSTGYVTIHGTRTGDYDALLTLFLTANIFFLFSFIETKRNIFIYMFFITLGFSVLTKSSAGLFYLPGVFLFILFDRKLLFFLKNKHVYFSLFIFLGMIGGYYLLRENINPGYLKAVYENELGGRFKAQTDGEPEKEKLFYLKNLGNDLKRFDFWYPFLPFGFLIGLLNQNKKLFRLSLYISLLLFFHSLVLIFSKTKYHWYDTPWYPLMSILVAISIYQIFIWLKEDNFNWKNIYLPEFNSKKLIVPILFLLLLFGKPYYETIKRVGFSDSDGYDRNMALIALYFQDVIKKDKKIEDDIVICTQHPIYNSLFYIKQLRENGKKIEFVDWKTIKKGQIVLTGHDDKIKSLIEEHFEVKILEHHQDDWEHWHLKKYKILNQIKEIE